MNQQEVFALSTNLDVRVFEHAQEAIDHGFVYRAPEYTPVKIEKVVVVKKGTQNGNPTVDLLLIDETGKKYMTMTTAALLRSIAGIRA